MENTPWAKSPTCGMFDLIEIISAEPPLANFSLRDVQLFSQTQERTDTRVRHELLKPSPDADGVIYGQ